RQRLRQRDDEEALVAAAQPAPAVPLHDLDLPRAELHPAREVADVVTAEVVREDDALARLEVIVRPRALTGLRRRQRVPLRVDRLLPLRRRPVDARLVRRRTLHRV